MVVFDVKPDSSQHSADYSDNVVTLSGHHYFHIDFDTWKSYTGGEKNISKTFQNY